ncbi:MAG: UDP-N-acetylmuramoyl-L-alanyl-D-glutamate--2,6-diaminopimelate ligase [Muribaculaceae bacterium]|nr:UDP-N-acetylmuramoyl-L-alanyl-D-glutamate--2,6-diaminopimelate ligase [Muribaculaceae bacterium]
MKLLSQITSTINILSREGNTDDIKIKDIVSDSRKDVEGALFIAVKGVNVDGHTFVNDVVARGAAAVVVEELPKKLNPKVAYLKVENSAIALGEISSQWFDNPSSKLKLVGVTGTNGKTTTATLIYEMAHLMGFKAGLLSTVKNYIDYEAVPATHTTPSPIELNSLLARMVDAGCEYAAMELSSHAAHQHRIAGLTFAGGVFTNLTRDHLDYHKTFEAYLAAKQSFFDMLPSTAFALTNIDDKNGEIIIQNTKAKRLTYSLRRSSDYLGRIIEQRLDGTLMSFNMNEVEVMFTGRFNAYNLTALYGTAIQLGWQSEKVLLNMSRLVPVSGRFQTFRSPRRGYVAIVDYAHTPDAVVNVLHTIREIIGNHGKIITVVGAGGNRDKGKRPIMAAEAAKLSDRLILTSDHPRDEDTRQIIADMREGLDTPLLRNKTISITYRDEAIRTGAYIALPGDVLLIAGKGHEDYQEINGVRHHFDDSEVIKDIFANEN